LAWWVSAWLAGWLEARLAGEKHWSRFTELPIVFTLLIVSLAEPNDIINITTTRKFTNRLPLFHSLLITVGIYCRLWQQPYLLVMN
jgi:hypothetical protein